MASFFAIIYWVCGYFCHPGIIKNLFNVYGTPVNRWLALLRAFYFSVVTMTTLGFGDMYANPQSWVGYILLIFQVLMGYIFLAVLVTRLGVLYTSGGPVDGDREKATGRIIVRK